MRLLQIPQTFVDTFTGEGGPTSFSSVSLQLLVSFLSAVSRESDSWLAMLSLFPGAHGTSAEPKGSKYAERFSRSPSPLSVASLTADSWDSSLVWEASLVEEAAGCKWG